MMLILMDIWDSVRGFMASGGDVLWLVAAALTPPICFRLFHISSRSSDISFSIVVAFVFSVSTRTVYLSSSSYRRSSCDCSKGLIGRVMLRVWSLETSALSVSFSARSVSSVACCRLSTWNVLEGEFTVSRREKIGYICSLLDHFHGQTHCGPQSPCSAALAGP